MLAQVTMVTLSAEKDNTLYENVQGAVSNGSGEFFFIGNATNLSATRRALLKFDIAGSIPANATIQSVELSLEMSRTIAPALDANLFRVDQDWGEGTTNAGGEEGGGAPADPNEATWLHTFSTASFWNTIGGDFQAASSGSSSIAGLGAYTFPSTAGMVSDVQLWLDSSALNHGWVILGDESVATSAKRFNSRENPDQATRPALTVSYTTRLPVELSSFGVQVQNGQILLDWSTSSENQNSGFAVELAEMRLDYSGTSQLASWNQIGFVEGNGNSLETNSYSFEYTPNVPGVHRFRLKQIDFDGQFEYSPELEASVDLPGGHYLSEVYPNPFSSRASFTLSLAQDQFVEITLHNQLGQIVQEIYAGELSAGIPQKMKIDSANLTAGIYFYRVTGSNFSDSGQVHLVK